MLQACPRDCILSSTIFGSSDSNSPTYFYPEACPVSCGTGFQDSYKIVLVTAANGGVACPTTQVCSDAVVLNAMEFHDLELNTTVVQHCVATSKLCNTEVSVLVLFNLNSVINVCTCVLKHTHI